MKGHRPLSHAQYVLINRLAMPVGAFVILIAIGRQSDALLGQYALVMTYYFIMQMLPLLGLTSYVMREVARDPSQAERYFTTVGFLSIIGCVAVAILCFALLQFVRYPSPVLHAIAIVGVLIFPGIVLFLAELLFMSVHRTRPIAQVAIVENVARVALSIAVMWLGGELTALLWVFFATRVAALAVYLVQLRRMGIVVHFSAPDPALLRRTVALLPSFFVGTVLFAVFSRLDFVVLSLYESVEVIGYYAIAYRPFEISIMILTALVMTLFPWAARVFSRSPRRFPVAARIALLFFAGGLVFVSAAGTLLGDEYVAVLFARQYPKPVLLTQLYMAAVVLSGLDFVLSSLLHASDRQHSDTRAMMWGGLAQVALLFVLIPRFGMYGAFGAKFVATLVQLSIKLLLLERALGRLLGAGELLRLGAFVVILAALTRLFFDFGWMVQVPVAIVLGVAIVPGVALAFGLVQPLRLLRYLRRPRDVVDVATVADLLDVAARDAREHVYRTRRAGAGAPCRGASMDRRLAATLFYRVARHLHLNGRRALSEIVTWSGRIITRVRIDPASPTKPEWDPA